jgi:hypothetical protein
MNVTILGAQKCSMDKYSNLKKIPTILNCLDNESATFSFSDQSLDGICCGYCPAE